jgi:hypothetical protein
MKSGFPVEAAFFLFHLQIFKKISVFRVGKINMKLYYRYILVKHGKNVVKKPDSTFS